MDYTDGASSRNGVDGQYFDFLGIGAKSKLKKYANKLTDEISQKFPPQATVEAQQAQILQLKKDRAFWETELAKARKKRNKDFANSMISAHTEYIRDAEAHLAELQLAAAAAQVNPKNGETPPFMPVETATIPPEKEPSGAGNTAPGQPGAPKATSGGLNPHVAPPAPAAAGQPAKPTNTMLYIGVGVVALVVLFALKK